MAGLRKEEREAKKKRAIALAKKGDSLQLIAAKTGLSYYTVRRLIKAAGIEVESDSGYLSRDEMRKANVLPPTPPFNYRKYHAKKKKK